MRQAILVKFLGPTNTRDARWKARADAGSVTLPHATDVGPHENAERAARELAVTLSWLLPGDRLAGGTLPGPGMAFCFVIVPSEVAP